MPTGVYKHRKHTDKELDVISKSLIGNKRRLGSKQSEDFKQKKRMAFTGENNPRWNGGITTEDIKIRTSIESRLWRNAVFARDNWTCQKCNTRGVHLNAHHIKSFAKFKELRTAISNGITFCKKCHKKLHIKYGNKNCDEHSLKEFLTLNK